MSADNPETDLGHGPAPGGSGFDMGALFSQLGQMQQSLQDAQDAAAAQVVEGSAGGGAVRVSVNGALVFQQVLIDPSAVDPDDVEMLQDLVLAAIRDAMEKASILASNALGQAALPDLGALGLPGLDLGALTGREPEPPE